MMEPSGIRWNFQMSVDEEHPWILFRDDTVTQCSLNSKTLSGMISRDEALEGYKSLEDYVPAFVALSPGTRSRARTSWR